jgi:flavin-dependent dehydrogenase
VLSFKGGYGGMVMADQGVLTLACCVRRDRLAALRLVSPGLSAGAVVEALLKRECAGVAAALQPASRIGPWLASGPLAPGIRLRAEDPIFRVGNAAAEAHPIIGEGMSMALQSAWLLCKHLIGDRERPTLLDESWQRAVGKSYARDWRRQFAGRLRLASALAHLAMRPGIASPLMTLIRAWPGLLRLGAMWGGKTRLVTTNRSTP